MSLSLPPPSIGELSLPEAEARPHPAAFPRKIIEVLRDLVPRGRVLDVFAGVGNIALLGDGWDVACLEMEWEWAVQAKDKAPWTLVGDALALPFKDGSWPCVATSPPYSNRLSDAYVPKTPKPSDKTRASYRIALGRELKPGNSAKFHWGGRYRALSVGAVAEIHRVLEPGGLFVLNCKNHVRGGKEIPVTEFWVRAALSAGFGTVKGRHVPVQGDQNTARRRSQGLPTIDHEAVYVLKKLPRKAVSELVLP